MGHPAKKLPPQVAAPARPALVRARPPQAAFPYPSAFDVARLILQPQRAAEMGPADWPPLVAAALEQGAASLLAIRLRGQNLPDGVHAELARVYRANVARNLFLAQELLALQIAFTEHGLPFFTLKGPELAEGLYGDAAARQVADLDLLIRPADLPAADVLLRSAGFTRDAQESIARLQECRDVLYQRQVAGGRLLYLDLHMRLRPYGRRDALTEMLWNEPPVTAQCPARPMRNMSEEHLLLCLCMNVMTHRFARLQPWLDLASLLRRSERSLHWMRVREQALRLEWPAGVYTCLRVAAELAERRIPDVVMRALVPGAPQRGIIESLLGRDAATVLRRAHLLDGPRGTLAALACERGALAQLRLAGAILFPPAATLRQMDAPSRAAPAPIHYMDRLLRKAVRFFAG